MSFSVRPPAVAGTFYPATPRKLQRVVRKTVQGVTPAPPAIAAVVPHAGLAYSGCAAGRVFGSIPLPATIFILAPNHTGTFGTPGVASVPAEAEFQVPTGSVWVATEWVDRLCQLTPLIERFSGAHRTEHAIEVELPFLVELAPSAKIVPIIIPWDDWHACRALGTSIAQLVTSWSQPVLLIASSDMTHYESAARAKVKDEMALACIRELDGERLLETCKRERISMCGRAPTATVMEAARLLGAATGEVVDYRHSGMVTGEDDKVVSYAAVVIR